MSIMIERLLNAFSWLPSRLSRCLDMDHKGRIVRATRALVAGQVTDRKIEREEHPGP